MENDTKLEDSFYLENIEYEEVLSIIHDFINYLIDKNSEFSIKFPDEEVKTIDGFNNAITSYIHGKIKKTELKSIRINAWKIHDAALEPKKSIFRIIIFGLYERDFESFDPDYIASDIFNAIIFILKKINSNWEKIFIKFISNHPILQKNLK